MQTRGIRNNNPGNIDYSVHNDWLGQVGIEEGAKPRFARFSAPEYGIRAICKLLQSYAARHGANTIETVVARYAPAHENKTDRYIENVSKWSGIPANAPFNPRSEETLMRLVPAIIRQENGIQPYSEETLRRAIEMAVK